MPCDTTGSPWGTPETKEYSLRSLESVIIQYEYMTFLSGAVRRGNCQSGVPPHKVRVALCVVEGPRILLSRMMYIEQCTPSAKRIDRK